MGLCEVMYAEENNLYFSQSVFSITVTQREQQFECERMC